MILHGTKSDLTGTPRREILRYMGYRKGAPEEPSARIDAEWQAQLNAAEPAAVYKVFPLERREEGLMIGGCLFASRVLEKNLKGCSRVCLMAATLGWAVDTRIRRAAYSDALTPLIAQAVGAAMAEEWCNRVNETIRREAAPDLCRPRFSPGFGDLDLSNQKHFEQLLGMERAIGIRLTETMLMLPSKSVTALIGVAESPQKDGYHESDLS